MPTLRLALTAPMFGAAAGGSEKEGIATVMALMNDYCLTRDDWEALLEMTRIKVRRHVTFRLRVYTSQMLSLCHTVTVI